VKSTAKQSKENHKRQDKEKDLAGALNPTLKRACLFDGAGETTGKRIWEGNREEKINASEDWFQLC
jgi:hypothetical protein